MSSDQRLIRSLNRYYDFARAYQLPQQELLNFVMGLLVAEGLNVELAARLLSLSPTESRLAESDSEPDEMPANDALLSPRSGDRLLTKLWQQVDGVAGLASHFQSIPRDVDIDQPQSTSATASSSSSTSSADMS